MRRNNRRGAHSGDRLSKIVRDSFTSDFVRETGSRMNTFVAEQPVLSLCLGIAAGFLLGSLVRRGAR